MSRKAGVLGNPVAQDRLRKHEKLRQAIRDADTRAVMGTAGGRRFVWALLAGRTNSFSVSYTGEALGTAHNEGRRAVGLELMVELQALCPEAYVLMLQEAMSAQSEDVHARGEAESVKETDSGD